MIAPGEGQDLRTSRHRACKLQRHEVRLGSGITEADHFDGGNAVADRFGEVALVDARTAKADPTVKRGCNGLTDRRMGMSVEAGGQVIHEVEIAMAIDIMDATALGAIEYDRKGIVVECNARVPAG